MPLPRRQHPGLTYEHFSPTGQSEQGQSCNPPLASTFLSKGLTLPSTANVRFPATRRRNARSK